MFVWITLWLSYRRIVYHTQDVGRRRLTAQVYVIFCVECIGSLNSDSFLGDFDAE